MSNPGVVGNTYFFSPTAPLPTSLQTTISFSNSNEIPAPLACTMAHLSVGAIVRTAGSGTADTFTFTAYKNGSAQPLTCNFSIGNGVGSQGSCSDTTHSFSVAAGDALSMAFSETQGSNSPVAEVGVMLKCQ
jgi:hypothetical protein